MKIRFKLFLLIIGMLVLLSGAASVFFILNAPVQRIERERGVLNTLLDAIQTLLVEANRLDSATFVSERPIFDAAIARLGEAFKHVQGVQYLRISDPALAESIDIIERLNALNDDNLRSIKEIYDQLYADARTIFMFPDGITFRRFHQREYVINKDPRPFEIAQYNLARFESASVNLNYSLESSAQIITEQGVVIDDQIQDNMDDSSSLVTAIASYNYNQAIAATDDTSPIFAVHMAEDGLCGINGKGMIQVENLGILEGKDAEGKRIKFYCGMRLTNKRKAAVLLNANYSG